MCYYIDELEVDFMEKRLYIKEPGSAITHFIGMIMAIIAAIPLLYRAAREPSKLYIVSLTIYAASLILLYLIAGSYTPVCLLVIGGRKGITLLCIVWAFAIVGILIKAFWVFCPKWVSSVLYIGMGWTCVLAFSAILDNLSAAAFGWLLAGGIIYTVGGVIYALKLPIFNSKHKNFGSHEIFHLFVMGGSICHFVVMYTFLLP